MRTSALLSALRVGGRQHITASILRARPQATGSHVFRMPRFRQVREKVANGAAVKSSPFSVGGHEWHVECYPNGDDDQTKGYMSVYLQHASHARTGDAMARFNLSILDNKASEPSRSFTGINGGRRFTGDGWGWDKLIKLQDLEEQKHLLDDDDDGCLSVVCDVTVDPGLHSDEYTGGGEAEELACRPPPPFVLHGLAEAIWNVKEPDVKIVVGGEGDGGQTFAAHRWVLEALSPVLKADLALASSNAAATTVAELRVDAMDADVCEALLRFMYTNGSSPPPPQQLAGMAERLLVAADRYELEKLKLLCEEALCEKIDTTSVAAVLVLAERHGCPVLREACMRFLSVPDNLNAVLVSSDGLEKMKTGCPSALLEIAEKKDAAT